MKTIEDLTGKKEAKIVVTIEEAEKLENGEVGFGGEVQIDDESMNEFQKLLGVEDKDELHEILKEMACVSLMVTDADLTAYVGEEIEVPYHVILGAMAGHVMAQNHAMEHSAENIVGSILSGILGGIATPDGDLPDELKKELHLEDVLRAVSKEDISDDIKDELEDK